MPTLYISGRDTVARMEDRRAVVKWNCHDTAKQEVMKVPVHDIDRVVVLGTPSITMPLLDAFLEKSLPVYFLNARGRWKGVLHSGDQETSLRRMKQYRANGDASLRTGIARALVEAKIRNMRRVLQRLAANRGLSREEDQRLVCQVLEECLRKARRAESPDALRGYEGAATAAYFRRLAAFFPKDMPFGGRSRRPPRDPANALMSFAYTMVAAEIETAIRCAGLDPGFGFLHELSFGRPSLAYDLLEPLRAPLCDLMVLDLLNHRRMTQEDFETEPDGGVRMKESGRGGFFREYEEYMERQFAERKDGSRVTFRRVIQKMVQNVCGRLDLEPGAEFFIMP